MRSLALKILTGIAAAILSLGLAEVVVRALGLAPEIAPIEIDTPYGPFVSASDPRLIYRLKPGVGDVNAYGIRDRDRDIQKRDGTYRIVVLGDSIAFGLCSGRQGTIALEDLFTARLERALNAWRPPFEVWNLAVSGYNTTQETIFFEEKGLPLSPDLVIVAYALNDHRDRAAELKQFMRNPDFVRVRYLVGEIRKNALLRSELVRAIWYRTGGARDATETEDTPRLPYAEKVSADFARLRELSATHGFDVLVVVFPTLTQQINGVYKLADRHELVVDIAKSLGFDALDLLPGFLEAGDGDLRTLLGRCTAMHPDERGHRIAAELIFDHLKDVMKARGV